MKHTRIPLFVIWLALLAAGAGVSAMPVDVPNAEVGRQAAGKCVDIGAPKPDKSFTYRYTDSSGASSEYTNRWEQFTATNSRLVTTRTGRGAGVSTYTSQFQIVNDVLVLAASSASGTDASGPFTTSMSYSPGAIGDVAFRACEGQSWQIPSVQATNQSARGKFTATTDVGTLRVNAIGVATKVPAGTFNTVHYTKTMRTRDGDMVDEFWKSTEHGVTVRRTFSGPGGSKGSEELQAIK